MTRADAGRLGGTVTLQRYGKEQLTTWGKLGGRPRALTYHDIIRQRQRLELNNKKEVQGPPGSHDLRKLRKRLNLRHGSNGVNEIPEAGTAQETPREQVPAGKKSG